MKLRANLSVRSVLPDKLDDFLQTDIIKGHLKKENPNEQEFFNETSIIARKEVPAPPSPPPSPPTILRYPPLDPACPLFKIFVSLPFFLFHSLLRYYRQFPQPSRNPLLP